MGWLLRTDGAAGSIWDRLRRPDEASDNLSVGFTVALPREINGRQGRPAQLFFLVFPLRLVAVCVPASAIDPPS